MNKTRLALAVLLLAASLPLRAQNAPPTLPPAAGAPVAKPQAACPCDDYKFKPLNDKARAVAEYWVARRKYKSTSGVAGVVGLFAILAHHGGALQEAQNALTNAQSELAAARAKAESLGGIKTTGGDDKTVEIKLKKGVDYTLTP